jgi:hypothetical protein
MDATSEPGGLSPFPEHTELRKNPPFHLSAKNGLFLVSDLDFTLVTYASQPHCILSLFGKRFLLSMRGSANRIVVNLIFDDVLSWIGLDWMVWFFPER